jgi:hypothetical protein
LFTSISSNNEGSNTETNNISSNSKGSNKDDKAKMFKHRTLTKAQTNLIKLR